MQQLLNKLENIKGRLRANPIADLREEIREVKSLLKEMLLAQEIASLKALIADLKGSKVQSTDDITSVAGETDHDSNPQDLPMQDPESALQQLERITAMKMIDGVRNFILHRACDNFEYDNHAGKTTYDSNEETNWIADQEFADASQKGNNPVISCFIPENSIKEVVGQSGDVGGMGEALSTPTNLEYKVVVNPGSYTIYREIKNLSSK